MKRLCLAVLVLALAGCQTQQQSAPPSPAPPSINHPSPPPAIASAGPLTRAAVETYMDAQEADLRSYLRGQGVLVARRGDGLVVIVPVDRLFEKTALSAWGEAVLTSVSQVLRHYDHTAVEVDSYTDSSGTEQQNLALSDRRAKLVSEALAGSGVASARVSAYGLGATNPKVNDPKDARNRRIELKITPTPSG
jgi:outer membrane protein OmpA-like peptidoglycan-associated protein